MSLALLIVWIPVAAWCGLSFYLVGSDAIILGAWPVVFGLVVSYKFQKHKKRETAKASDTSQVDAESLETRKSP